MLKIGHINNKILDFYIETAHYAVLFHSLLTIPGNFQVQSVSSPAVIGVHQTVMGWSYLEISRSSQQQWKYTLLGNFQELSAEVQ